jgi:hypothetical protein
MYYILNKKVMKTIKNKKTGEIQRVEDRTAHNMVGPSWEFIAKSEWKKIREIKSEKQNLENEKKEETKNKKQEKREKLKQKQRN